MQLLFVFVLLLLLLLLFLLLLYIIMVSNCVVFYLRDVSPGSPRF